MLLNEFQVKGHIIRTQDSLLDSHLSDEWKSMTSSAYHLRPEMLYLLEKARPADLHFRYLFIYSSEEKNKLCGIVYLQVLNFNHRNFNFSRKTPLHYLAMWALRLRPVKILLAGCLFSVDFSPMSFDKQKLSPEFMIQILEEYSKIEKYDILVLKDLPETFDKELLSKHGYNPFETDLTMQLEINQQWKSLSDYEKALTHKYAQRVRKVRKQGSSIVRREIHFDEFKDRRTRINDLFHQVSNKQTVRMGIVDDNYFEELFKTLGPDFRLTGYFLNKELIAFASHILYPEKLEVHYIGIDYKYNQEYALYFNILFDGIIMAISESKRSLELGRTAREAKAVVGCHPIYFNDYLKVRNRITAWLLELLRNYFNQGIGEGWKKRHPFKTIATNIANK